MSRVVLITVRLHEGRYHGVGDGPPSPARLFQALVAGVCLSGPLGPEEKALKWLEERDPPVIASPRMTAGQRVKNYVPNNDFDAVGGDARRVAAIRTNKIITPCLFSVEIPFYYAWGFDGGGRDAQYAASICTLSERLYQFGRGVDLAWACGEVLDHDELATRLSTYQGLVYRPSLGGSPGRALACPQHGSLKSLKDRYEAGARRFTYERLSPSLRQLFSQPPKPRFRQVAYESPPSRRVYELRERSAETSFCVWPLAQTSHLVVALRDRAVERLRGALAAQGSEIERVLVGRKADGADDGPTSLRIRIVPLPSIGHRHVDRGIRRVLVEVPAGCPLRADDVHWAFSGLELVDPETGESLDITPTSDGAMLAHYGMLEAARSRVWRTVIPAALPESARRRRINPARRNAEAKGGMERLAEQSRAAVAVSQALRHAEVRARADAVRVQREPFDAHGERVEAFAQGTRFAKERLWHVEITFNTPIAGLLNIGDGRFLGLGLMAPVRRSDEVHAFGVEAGLAATTQPIEAARALRRAVMARVQDVLGVRRRLPTFITGHEPDGSVAQTGRHPHLTYVFDPGAARLLVIPPHVVDRRDPTDYEVRHLDTLNSAVTGLRELRAGSAGCLMLRASSIHHSEDPLFAVAQTWESVTPYQVTRHAKRVSASEALRLDLREECRRRGLPFPEVTPFEICGVPGVGLVGRVRLRFHSAVGGPIILGRSRHLGGGLFQGLRE